MIIHIYDNDRNVKAAHLQEIFGHYGTVKYAELEFDKRLGLSKCIGYVTFEKADEAEQAVLHLDGGQLDGQLLKVSFVLVSNKKRRESPGLSI